MTNPNVAIVMPVAKRPEMAALSLEALRNAVGKSQLSNYSLQIFIDDSGEHLAEDFYYVKETYFPSASIYKRAPHIKVPSGCWNILQSIKDGYKTNADLVCLVEEDVRVYPEYLDWTINTMQNTDCAATCPRWTKMVMKYGQVYQNPGACLRRSTLEKLMLHINDGYFLRLRGYLDEHFSKHDYWSDLDDGLIRRVIHDSGGWCAYPKLDEGAKVRHSGFSFYDEIDIYKNPETDIAKRIEWLRNLERRIKPTDRYAKDFEPFKES
jgi:hypothetical protein